MKAYLCCLFLLLALVPIIQGIVTTPNYLPITGSINWITPSTGLALYLNYTVAVTRTWGKVWSVLNLGADRIRTIYVYPPGSQFVGTAFLLGFYSNQSYWYESDGTLTPVKIPIRVNEISLHPTVRSIFLGLDRPETWGPAPLFLIDSSANPVKATQIQSMTYNYHHGFAGTGTVPLGRVCALADASATQIRRLQISNDYGKTWTTKIDDVVTSFLVNTNFFFAVTKNSNLLVSRDYANTWKKTIFPSATPIYDFQPENILEDRYGNVWIGGISTNYEYGRPLEGDLFISNWDGSQYTVAAQKVVTLNNWWDFAPERSVDGFYIVNVLLPWEDGTYVRPDRSVQARSAISDDSGVTWLSLVPPSIDSEGNNISCSGFSCALNLFGETTYLGISGTFYGGIYTSPAAIGLVIGTGNIGLALDMSGRDKVNTYISRDAGYTWREARKGSHVAAYGNHDGILLLVRNQVPTIELHYSLDQGATWITYNFTDVPVVVNSVYATSPVATAFQIKASLDGLVYFTVDFSDIHQRNCGRADYEPWAPAKGECVLGHRITYQRRQPGALCFTTEDYNHTAVVSNCACSPKDYECDVDFVKTGTNICIGTAPDPISSGLCSGSGGNYPRTQGFRKIPGNTCTGDLAKYEPIDTACPILSKEKDPEGLSNGGVVGIMFIFIILVGIISFVGGIYASHKHHFVRSKVPQAWTTESARLI